MVKYSNNPLTRNAYLVNYPYAWLNHFISVQVKAFNMDCLVCLTSNLDKIDALSL